MLWNIVDNLWRWIESLWSTVFNCKISGTFFKNIWGYALGVVDIEYYLKLSDSVGIEYSEV